MPKSLLASGTGGRAGDDGRGSNRISGNHEAVDEMMSFCWKKPGANGAG
jgi:hypothetical protein